MDMTALLVVAATIFLWGTVSVRLGRADLTAPVVFVVVGGFLGWTGLVDGPASSCACSGSDSR